jgi:hypothetical protein
VALVPSRRCGWLPLALRDELAVCCERHRAVRKRVITLALRAFLSDEPGTDFPAGRRSRRVPLLRRAALSAAVGAARRPLVSAGHGVRQAVGLGRVLENAMTHAFRRSRGGGGLARAGPTASPRLGRIPYVSGFVRYAS